LLAIDEKSSENTMVSDIGEYADRIRPIGVLYVDVHPFRVSERQGLEYLLLRRVEGVPLAGQWQTVSGKIQQGERIADAFVRQVRKKTGQDPLRIFKLAEVTTFYDEYYDTVMMVPGAAAELSGDHEVRIDPSLHRESRWANEQLARELLPWPAQRRALSTISAMISAGGVSAECTPLPPSAFTESAPTRQAHE
jgi:ADP-ribose pyrophosphatase YjhB (NUDIX family)